MKHIVVTILVVVAVSSILCFILTIMGVSKEMAVPLATSLFGLTTTVESWLSRRANTIGVTQGITPNADRYSLAWPSALTISILLYVGLGQFASAVMAVPLLLGHQKPVQAMDHRMIAGFVAVMVMIQMVGSVVIGKSLGQRTKNCGWIVVICGVFLARLIAVTVDYILLSTDMYLQITGLQKSWLAYVIKLEISYYFYLIPSLIGFAAGFNSRKRGHLLFRYDLMTEAEREKVHLSAGVM